MLTLALVIAFPFAFFLGTLTPALITRLRRRSSSAPLPSIHPDVLVAREELQAIPVEVRHDDYLTEAAPDSQVRPLSA